MHKPFPHSSCISRAWKSGQFPSKCLSCYLYRMYYIVKDSLLLLVLAADWMQQNSPLNKNSSFLLASCHCLCPWSISTSPFYFPFPLPGQPGMQCIAYVGIMLHLWWTHKFISSPLEKLVEDGIVSFHLHSFRLLRTNLCHYAYLTEDTLEQAILLCKEAVEVKNLQCYWTFQ